MKYRTSLAQIWSEYADNLYSNMQDLLWSDDLQFWIDVVEGTNLACKGRELIGYFPYRFGVGTEEKYIRGLEVGLTNGAFIAEFGPTTLEQTNPYYTPFKNTTYCCMWQGQSWPFSTSVFLATLAGLARDGVSAVATAEFFNEALSTYVRTNYKEGVPYTAESHYPTVDEWSGDTSEFLCIISSFIVVPYKARTRKCLRGVTVHISSYRIDICSLQTNIKT